MVSEEDKLAALRYKLACKEAMITSKEWISPRKILSLPKKIGECQDKCGKTYGYRRVYIWLERNGIHKNPKTVLRVMRKYNLQSAFRMVLRDRRVLFVAFSLSDEPYICQSLL